jgi:hypothetical protein
VRSSPSATSAGMRRAAPSSKVSLSPGFTDSALLLFKAWLKGFSSLWVGFSNRCYRFLVPAALQN